MSDIAERWVTEQEIALLERIHTLESPPEAVDEREVIRIEARKVRVWRPRADGSPSPGTIGG